MNSAECRTNFIAGKTGLPPAPGKSLQVNQQGHIEAGIASSWQAANRCGKGNDRLGRERGCRCIIPSGFA